ncbi:MAG TPA: hypothetical protein DCL54_15040 [Alphaproteobacteria bacterium]|nr:hypothetical protein [Alphaproteobacteria bacterium]
MRLQIVLMLKVPVMGRVKTRLAREAGPTEAVRAYRAMVAALLRRLTLDRRWQLTLAIAPAADLRTTTFPAKLRCLGQTRGDLGARMQAVFDTMRAKGPTIIIGSDIPGISGEALAQAARLLGGHDAVLGPASDGGYWLVGLRGLKRRAPFGQVRWSGPHALADTLAGLKDARVALTGTLDDVDTLQDWQHWQRQPPSLRLQGGRGHPADRILGD